MRRINGLLAGIIASLIASSAFAQVDCTAGCTDTKYGFGTKPEYRKDEVPPDTFRYTNDFFGPDFGGQSFYSSRSDLTGALGSCGPQRNHSPLPGQVILREQTACTPTSFGPSCTAGTNIGADCHLPTLNEGCTGAGAPSACCTGAGTGTCSGFASSGANTLECGAGGTCTLGAGTSCRVEIPLSDGGVTPPAETSELLVFTLTSNATAPNGDTFSLSAQSGNALGGTSDDSNPLCLDSNVRRRPSMATRYLLPESRGGDGSATYLRWDSAKGLSEADRTDLSTALRLHNDDSALCCAAGTPSLGTCSVVVPPSTPNYPLLTLRNCGIPGRLITDDNIQADWIFAGGRGTAFHTDNDFVLPGQLAGICTINSSTSCYAPGANAACAASRNPFACCTGAGTGTCSDPCAALTPGDSCSFRTPGIRSQPRCVRDANGDTRVDCCGTAVYTIRGTPNSGCSVLSRFPYSGDPGSDCGVGNFGVDHRDDDDCNGVDDRIDAASGDYCPFYSEWDQDLDSDSDCADGAGGDCRGDECECGDQSGSGVLSGTEELGNGIVNVSDLVGINSAIFGSVVRKRLCDANSDTLCNVSDIVSANKEIFTPDSSVCRHITPRQCLTGVPDPCCGNGIIEGGEICDDGNISSGDGCNLACRIEFGFTCSGAPSVCN